MTNSHRLAEKGLYATIIVVIGGGRLLLRFIGFCMSFFTLGTEDRSLVENEPFDFINLLDLDKGNVLLFQNSQGEKVVRIYLGYHERKNGSFLFFFNEQDTDQIVFYAPTNKTGFDLYPELSWRVIGHNSTSKPGPNKRKKIGEIIKKLG